MNAKSKLKLKFFLGIFLAILAMSLFVTVTAVADDCPGGGDVAQCFEFCSDEFDDCNMQASSPEEVSACFTAWADCRGNCINCPI